MEHAYAETVVPPDGYTVHDGTPSPETFVRIREESGMVPRSLEAAEAGLPNTLYGVHARAAGGGVVGLARVVGDGGAVFHVADVAVVERHQGEGVGTALMEAVVAYLRREAPETAYVNLLADVDGFYERWGFEPSAPRSKGMVWNPVDRDDEGSSGSPSSTRRG